MTAANHPVIPPIRLSTIDLTVRPEPLALGPQVTQAVEAHWAMETARNPTLFNGSAFLFDHFEIDADAASLTAQGALTDYATFLYWREHRQQLSFHHTFPVGAIVTADDRLVIGRMSEHTANAGRHYPPAGSFDAGDIIVDADGIQRLDALGNIARETGEEIGLDFSSVTPDPDWLLMPSTPNAYAIIRVLRTQQTSSELAPALEAHIKADSHQELAALLYVDFNTRFAEGTASPYVNHLLAYLATKG